MAITEYNRGAYVDEVKAKVIKRSVGGCLMRSRTVNCVNCGHENPEKALICYWCGLDPDTGAQPYKALLAPVVVPEGELARVAATLPPTIEVPPTMPVPSFEINMAAPNLIDLMMPDLPPIEIAPPPDIPDEGQFVIVRRRASHRPVVRPSPGRMVVTRPVLPGWSRVLVFVAGLGLLYLLVSALVAAVGAASVGSAFCLLGLLGVAAVLWVVMLLARVATRVVTWRDAAYERLEVLGRVLREVAPGTVQELPVNLPKKVGVLDLPLAYSELRSLARPDGAPPMDAAVDLLTGAIAQLVGRDDVILAHRTYPLHSRGVLTRPVSTQVSRPVLTRRRAYVGPGDLEERIAKALRTDYSVTVDELVRTLVGPSGQEGAKRLLTLVDQALSAHPPDLETMASPDEALTELQQIREAVRRANPELYELLENEIRRGLGAVTRRSVPESLLDLARYSSTTDARSQDHQNRSGPRRRG